MGLYQDNSFSDQFDMKFRAVMIDTGKEREA